MAELAQLPRPVMCRSARLHSDHGRRQLGKKRQHLAAPQLPAQHRPLGGINPMQLKNMLRRIHSNSDNLVHGRLPCLRLQQPHSGTLDAVGGRPHHHAVPSRLGSVADGFFGHGQRWLWVSAFAGTTCREVFFVMSINAKPAVPSDDVHLIVAKDEEVVIEHYPEDWIAFALFWALAFIVFLQFFTRYIL